MVNDLPRSREGRPLHVDGREIPFTLWPDAYVKHGPYCAASPWQCLLTVVGWGGDDQRARRCKAFIHQSYEFYAASSGASISTRPLMLYYSYLNLAKAFLALRDDRAVLLEHHSHGLTWTGREEASGKLESIVVKVQADRKGTYPVFPELVAACGFPRPVPGTIFNLADMMYQIPGMHEAFIATRRRPRAFFPVDLQFRQNQAQKTVWLEGNIDMSFHSDADRARLEAFIRNSSNMARVRGGRNEIRFETPEPVSYTGSPASVLRNQVVAPIRNHLWTEQRPERFEHYLASSEGFTAQIGAHFAVMLALGMIVRYKPEVMDELGREWLIHEYLVTQPLQFAYLLGSGVVRNQIVPSPLSVTRGL